MFYTPNPGCGRHSGHPTPQASSAALSQREETPAALDCRTLGRGGAAARPGAFRKSGPGEQSPEPTGGRRQAGADRYGRVRQSGAWADFRHPDGAPAAGRVGRRNLRSSGYFLAAGGSAAPLQRAPHHPGALAHHVRHRQTAHQPPPADRQAGGGV